MKMGQFRIRTITTKYWRPGENYLEQIIRGIDGMLADGDFLVISEKALSTASGNIVEESEVTPSLTAKLIARFWMPICWGYLLGQVCHLRQRLVGQLQQYPFDEGSRHKQVVLKHAGFLNALMFGSEGGIDGSNLPYAYVSLAMKNADEVARHIRARVWRTLRKNIRVLIVDTDKTFSFRNFHFTPRPQPVKGIYSFGGLICYVVGRVLKLTKRATPLAVAGCKLPAERALEIAEAANRARGFGAGRTVWDMAGKFNVDLTHVSWEMLETVRHKPIFILRSKR